MQVVGEHLHDGRYAAGHEEVDDPVRTVGGDPAQGGDNAVEIIDIGDEIALRRNEVHPRVAFGHSVAGGGDVELKRQSPGCVYPFLDPLGNGPEVHVTGVDLSQRVRDADDRFGAALVQVDARALKDRLPYDADGKIAIVEDRCTLRFLHVPPSMFMPAVQAYHTRNSMTLEDLPHYLARHDKSIFDDAIEHYDAIGLAGNTNPDLAEPSWMPAWNREKYPDSHPLSVQEAHVI